RPFEDLGDPVEARDELPAKVVHRLDPYAPTMPSRVSTPRVIASGSSFEKARRNVFDPVPSTKNGAPGTYATPASTAASSRCRASTPVGSVTHTNNPPSGRVHVTSFPAKRSRAASIVRHRSA